ncbi:MAG: hypothetical protein LBD51_01200, partial [Bifidobacteriaceae bacterium]|nr:hypothetical protein [Bifidobacteriaceae bacterium]
MSLTELVLVIAISGLVMAMAAGVTVSVVRADGKNLVREANTAATREISLWLGEALTYASSPLPDSSGALEPAISKAAPDELAFTSALPFDGVSGPGALSRVTVKLGSTCWTNQASPGVLYRCVQGPDSVSSNGVPHWCDWGEATCDEKWFREQVVARNVKGEAIFAYYLDTAGVGAPASGASSVAVADVGRIAAVE